MPLELAPPSHVRLAGYAEALRRGWSPPDNVRGGAAAHVALALFEADPEGFLAALDDPDAKSGDIVLPDGSKVERLPGFHRWPWDSSFCGAIGLRWARGTAELPPHVLGHIGYSVAPWKRGRGYATRALALTLPLAAGQGLPWVELTADPENLASQKVILANGGRLVARFVKSAAFGGAEGSRLRIDLDSSAP